ncbi:hypothetical protein [Actinoplanes couchii]|uniref:Lipoprotein n=1 Tax=Actinoplanes couchii TaxID=403638 RepID=A0ABQ3XTW7_9ACTN|nr:hypothetical protein [Actinoplanes couchii]MDR6321970.1 hypothetical protein [Actinoplanes couchii]GID61921.1 hypothetical protein Aco03nite_103250 [Actinoplanes couchii]
MRKLFIVLAVLVTAGCSQVEVASAPWVADESVSERDLLNDALRIAFDRQDGVTQSYALVPATRPPGLVRMMPNGSHGDGGSFVTNYLFGRQELNALVELAPRETDTCELIKDGQSAAGTLCVRDDEVSANATGFTHVTVYFTGDGDVMPRAGAAETDEAAEFWARTEMVPIDEARWFTDLLERGTAAAAAAEA